MKAPVASEAQEHAAVADYLNLIEKTTPGFWWTTVGHGNFMGYAAIGRRRRLGTKPGVPDILIVYRGRAFMPELKRRRGDTVSEAQVKTMAAINAAGGCAVVVKGFRQLELFVEALLAEETPDDL